MAQILGRPGASREIQWSRPVEGVATALASVAEDPVEADLRADSVVEGILVSGSVDAATRLRCARCLRPYSSEVTVPVCELFAYGSQGSAEEDTYRVDGEVIDLEAMLRDALTLALPLRPLCREACAGLCGTCGRDLNDGACGCTQDESDPRWAGLSALRDKLNN